MSRLRTIIFGVYLTVTTALIGVFGVLTLLRGETGARFVTRTWARTALFGLGAICGLKHEVAGGGNLPKGACIIASNHQTMWETIAFLALAEKPAMLFKKELLNVPIYGWWGKRAGSIPVDRNAGPRAIREVSALAAQRLAAGFQIIVFPEGTRAKIGETLPLQPGVAAIYKAANAPCIPTLHDSGRFWKSPGGLFSLKTPGVIILNYLAPIESGLDRKVFQRRLEAALAPRSIIGLDSIDGIAPESSSVEGRPA